jgi:hypothetical protein
VSDLVVAAIFLVVVAGVLGIGIAIGMIAARRIDRMLEPAAGDEDAGPAAVPDTEEEQA